MQKVLKTYEEIADECFQKWGYYYPPKTWDEFYAWDNKSYEKYLTEKEEDVRKTKSYVSLLDTTKDFDFILPLKRKARNHHASIKSRF